jgi:RNA 2',3'-cyclic 3'-phosphodiesterase
VALPVPTDAAAELDARVRAARLRLTPTADADVRWVRADSFHLTLRFLGATPLDDLDAVGRAVSRAAEAVRPFDVRLGAVRTLGSRRSRTLVADVAQGAPAVAALSAALSDALAQLGRPRDPRPFRAHLTVGRVSRRPGGDETLREIAAGVTGEGIGWRVASVVLFESRLGSGPPIYVARAVSALVA